ncbi:interleukin-17 receptor C isoform X2 [Salminus brasiliensis]|uniref:interleukin-17 receptor C isoform X2 n=1 Tax=Salminus brasiliensis TaxID=930266 RepID=UPI003B831A3A
MGFWGSVLILLAGTVASSALLESHHPTQDIICSEGLDKCNKEEGSFLVQQVDFGPVEVSGVDVKPFLCCRDQKCEACLLITIQLQILNEEESSGAESAEGEDEDDAGITVRYYSGPNLPQYRRISFTVTTAARRNRANAELRVVEYRDVFLGSRVNVTVNSFNLSVTLPPLSEVCPYADLEECKTPRVIPLIDRLKKVVELKVVDEDVTHPEPLHICVKRGLMGTCWKSQSSIPLHTITSCMCFEAWTNGSRTAHCPFSKSEEFRENAVRNVSLSVGHTKSNEGRPVLSWTLSAPCRLEAEVWPCRMGAGSGSDCKEVPGFRVQRNKSSKWSENNTVLWTSGAFEDFSSERHFLHCVMFKVDGRISDPVCQHDTHRGRWSMPVLVMLLLFCLVGIGVCLLRRRFRGCVSDWEKTHHSGEAGGEVLLLHACGTDPGSVCALAVQLSELGFGVCLDLWSQKEVGSWGPGPWFHSKLTQLQKHGGKALVVLSDSALDMAEACWDSWTGEGAGVGKQGKADNRTPPCFSDVFGSALNCIFSAHLKGGAAEHFTLVHFDSQGLVKKDMPELFRGLELYDLPSESHQLLAQLCPERPGSISMRLKRLLWLRTASRRLTKGLKSSGKGLRPHADSVLTQEETLEEETLPLQR